MRNLDQFYRHLITIALVILVLGLAGAFLINPITGVIVLALLVVFNVVASPLRVARAWTGLRHLRGLGYRELGFREALYLTSRAGKRLYQIPPRDEAFVTALPTGESEYVDLIRAVELLEEIDPKYEEFYEFAKREAALWHNQKEKGGEPFVR